ncbi:hypothetical protein [Limnoglobus roseus]|uniref:Uncharacterized protein n=1 Tax=Limnoglobus roseus TaxID=2598579 RepID=A0A5C1A642_9BACT|nr:hypothetical protein [Limnoglobus roseus]QEL14150.1 hypothetical protein PX52LOC_01020 [Limnoglobus roseus]
MLKCFNGEHCGDSGRPASVRFCEAMEWDRIVGEVAVMLLTWPRYAPQTPEGLAENPGPATAEAIATATSWSVLDVREAIAELRKQTVG